MTRTRKPKQKIINKFNKEGLPATLDFLVSLYPKGLPFNTDFYEGLPEGIVESVLTEIEEGRLLLLGRDREESIARLQCIQNGSPSKQKTRPASLAKKPAVLPADSQSLLKKKTQGAQKRKKKKEREIERVLAERQDKEDLKNHYAAKSLDVHESGICPSDPKTWFCTDKRRVTIFCGPTNSGKTYDALEMLKQSSGVYLAPLRLMALEQYDILKVVGATELVTGEEHVSSRPGVRALFISATIEAISLDTHYETVVIDEAQMMFDEERGWAWTQAIMGVCADNLCVCTAPDALPVLLEMFREKGETPEVIQKERMTPLTKTPKISVSKIEEGDAVIAFSRKEVLAWKNTLEESGFSVSCIYGDLGPEVRRQQSEAFRKKETKVLVATDAIGMGLNLPIKRVVFTQTEKYDGTVERSLYKNEWQQIAGRAGRRGLYDVGFYTTLRGNLSEKMREHSGYWYRPHFKVIKASSEMLKTEKLSDILPMWLKPKNKIRSFKIWANQSLIAEIDKTAHTLKDKFIYACAPLRDTQTKQFLSWVVQHGNILKNQEEGVSSATIFFPSFTAKPTNIQSELQKLEQQSHLCNLYKWCRRHFPEVYVSDIDEKYQNLQNAISVSLAGKLYRTCSVSSCHKTLPSNFPHNMCQRCFKEMYFGDDYY